MVDFRQNLAKVRGLLQETLDSLEEIREHKADNAKVLKIMEKVGDLAKELAQFMPKVEALEKAAEAAETTFPILRISITAAGVWNKAAELWDLNLRGTEINDRLGEAAKDEKATDKDCKHHVDDFVREFRKLREMVEGQSKPSTTGSGEIVGAKEPASHSVGLSCKVLTDEQRMKLGIEGGAGVTVTNTRPGSPGERALQKGDIILKAGTNPVRTVDDLRACVVNVPADGTLELLILRDGKSQTVRLTFSERQKE